MKTQQLDLYTLDRVEMQALMNGKTVGITPTVLLAVDMKSIVRDALNENGNGNGHRKKSRTCSECDATLPNMAKLMKHRKRKHGKKSRAA